MDVGTPPLSTVLDTAVTTVKRRARVRAPELVGRGWLNTGGERDRVGLVLELRGVHADGDQDVGVLVLQGAQLVEHVQAVDAAEGPEVEDHDLAAQVGQCDRFVPGVEPAPSAQLRRPYPCHALHTARGSAALAAPVRSFTPFRLAHS